MPRSNKNYTFLIKNLKDFQHYTNDVFIANWHKYQQRRVTPSVSCFFSTFIIEQEHWFQYFQQQQQYHILTSVIEH
jgi:hypothetical protein